MTFFRLAAELQGGSARRNMDGSVLRHTHAEIPVSLRAPSIMARGRWVAPMSGGAWTRDMMGGATRPAANAVHGKRSGNG
jgi:hypothetical protein